MNSTDTLAALDHAPIRGYGYAPGEQAGGVQTVARQQSPVCADYNENFLIIHASKDGSLVGIDHPCDAEWTDVMAAHVAIRDRINDRIAAQDGCPFKPTDPLHTAALAAGYATVAEWVGAMVGERDALVAEYVTPNQPWKVTASFMGDAHWFATLKNATPEGMVDEAVELIKHGTATVHGDKLFGTYGMLCPLIVSSKRGELRRVGSCIHARTASDDDITAFRERAEGWVAALTADPDVMALLTARAALTKVQADV